MNRWKGRMLLLGGLVGTAYGLLAYAAFTSAGHLAWGPGRGVVASFSYLALVPLALSAVPLLFSDPDQMTWYRSALFIPWVSTFGMFLLLAVTQIEGALCFLVLVVPFVLLISTGVWLVRALSLWRLRKARRRAAGLLMMLLPFLTASFEHRWLTRVETNSVETVVLVRAAPGEVWRQIVEVPFIDDRELAPGLLHRLGLPRPLRATVDAPRLGGQRIGFFDGGLRFKETILAFEPQRRMLLGVTVDPATIANLPSLRHALEGGYMRLLAVEYRLHPQEVAGETRLSLACRYELRSSVNLYGQAWVNLILRDFEERLLPVIQARAEAAARRGTTPSALAPLCCL